MSVGQKRRDAEDVVAQADDGIVRPQDATDTQLRVIDDALGEQLSTGTAERLKGVQLDEENCAAGIGTGFGSPAMLPSRRLGRVGAGGGANHLIEQVAVVRPPAATMAAADPELAAARTRSPRRAVERSVSRQTSAATPAAPAAASAASNWPERPASADPRMRKATTKERGWSSSVSEGSCNGRI